MIKTVLTASLIFLGSAITVSPIHALTFNVNQNWTDPFFTPFSLTGTVDINQGLYTFNPNTNTPSPFTGINLILTVGSTPYSLNNSSILTGNTSTYTINVTASQVILNTSGGSGSSIDYLTFDGGGGNYIIGSDAAPGFQFGNGEAESISFPTIFATIAVPFEFSPTLGLGILGSAWLVRKTLRMKNSQKV